MNEIHVPGPRRVEMLHARGSSIDEHNPQNKRAKATPPQQQLIDLTTDSDDFMEASETEESSDEDVLILGSRNVSRNNTMGSVPNTRPTVVKTQPALTDAFQPLISQPNININQNTNFIDSLNPFRVQERTYFPNVPNDTDSSSNQMHQSHNDVNSHQTQLTATARDSSVPVEPTTINHIKPEITERMFDIDNNVTPGGCLTTRSVTFNGDRFRSVKELEDKEKKLKAALKEAQILLACTEKDISVYTELLRKTMASIQNSRDRKVSETDPSFIALQTSMHRFAASIKDHTNRKIARQIHVRDSTKDLLKFANHARPKITLIIRQLLQKEAGEARKKDAAKEIKPEKDAAKGIKPEANNSIPGMAIFGDMLRQLDPRRHFMSLDDEDDEIDDDEEQVLEYIGEGGNMQNNNRQGVHNNDPHDMNIYNADTTQDLRSFLESIKTLEDSKEGECNTPEGLTVNLLKHQRLGLHWLELNERDVKKKGGILADAMGLGKTVQTISLMLSRRSEDVSKKTNLIVCPVAMMRQWESEIKTKVKESANFKSFIFHPSSGNKNRINSYKQLSKFDVVFISYQTLASEMKKHIHGFDLGEMGIRRINAKKESNSYFSPFFSKESQFYRIVLDEAQWIKNKLTKSSLACSLLESDYRWCLSGTPMQNNIEEIYPLIRFLRIRPYCFEDRFRADISLPLKSRNDNYDSYDREKAMQKVRLMLKAILLRRSKNSVIDGEPILKLPEKKVVMTHIDMDENQEEAVFYRHLEGKSAIQVEKMLQKGLAKGNYSSILTLLLRLRQACLHSELVRIGERKQGFTFNDDGEIKKNATWDTMYHYAKDLKPEVVRRVNVLEAEDGESRFQCPICLDSPPDNDWTMFFPCGHGLCKECIESFFERFQESEANGIKVAKCSQCRLHVKETQLISYPIFDSVCNKNMSKEVVGLIHEKNQKELAKLNESLSKEIDSIKHSPKFSKALELIEKIQSENPDDKIILFSQFTTLFDLLEKFLHEDKIQSLRYDGSMTSDARNETIKEFYKSSTKKLLMLSLKAGNVGLTLTCANHVIIMDPFWNPYVEEQAQDRSHRIGQHKPVTVYRLLTTNTVEDRIMTLQQEKKELVESAMDEQGMKNVAGLGRREIEFLFNINR